MSAGGGMTKRRTNGRPHSPPESVPGTYEPASPISWLPAAQRVAKGANKFTKDNVPRNADGQKAGEGKDGGKRREKQTKEEEKRKKKKKKRARAKQRERKRGKERKEERKEERTREREKVIEIER